ncbi:MmyB family transcriptional regulator, partial [Clostridioides difficile]
MHLLESPPQSPVRPDDAPRYPPSPRLARPVPARRKRVSRADVAVPRALALLASMPSVPALLLGRRNDVLAWNRLGYALVAGHLAFTDPDDPATRPNQMRLLFLDP